MRAVIFPTQIFSPCFQSLHQYHSFSGLQHKLRLVILSVTNRRMVKMDIWTMKKNQCSLPSFSKKQLPTFLLRKAHEVSRRPRTDSGYHEEWLKRRNAKTTTCHLDNAQTPSERPRSMDDKSRQAKWHLKYSELALAHPCSTEKKCCHAQHLVMWIWVDIVHHEVVYSLLGV